MRARRWAFASFAAVFSLAAPAAGATGATAVVFVACGATPAGGPPAATAGGAFVKAVAAAAKLPPGSVTFEGAGCDARSTARLARPDAGLAVVPLPFYLAHHAELTLVARLQAVRTGGNGGETWSLLAAKGRVVKPADLDRWQIVTATAYAPRFVGLALAGWGRPPDTVRIVPASQLVSGLRRAAATENVALLLDSAEARESAALPVSAPLAVVTTSTPLPGWLLCTIGTHLPEARRQALTSALARLSDGANGTAAMGSVGLARFSSVDRTALTALERAYASHP